MEVATEGKPITLGPIWAPCEPSDTASSPLKSDKPPSIVDTLYQKPDDGHLEMPHLAWDLLPIIAGLFPSCLGFLLVIVQHWVNHTPLDISLLVMSAFVATAILIGVVPTSIVEPAKSPHPSRRATPSD